MKSVLDASALLAALKAETGAAHVRAALIEGACMSGVNLSEVLAKLAEVGAEPQVAFDNIAGPDGGQGIVAIEPFGSADAIVAAELRIPTRAAGLSLGDRACLALGRRMALPVLTTDRAWEGLDVGVEIRVIR